MRPIHYLKITDQAEAGVARSWRAENMKKHLQQIKLFIIAVYSV